MRTFADKTGQQWTIDLTFGCVSRVKALIGHDLLRPEKKLEHDELGQTSLQAVVLLHLPTLVDILYCVCQPQCEQRGITSTQFGELMAPACVIDAREKFREEWQDFFRQLQRPDQAMALEKMGAWLKAATTKLDRAMQAAELERIDRAVTEAMDTSLRKSFGSLEASLALIRGDTHGGSST